MTCHSEPRQRLFKKHFSSLAEHSSLSGQQVAFDGLEVDEVGLEGQFQATNFERPAFDRKLDKPIGTAAPEPAMRGLGA